MAIAVGDRSRAIARSHVQSWEHTASGAASSPPGRGLFCLVAAWCAHDRAHQASCVRRYGSTFSRLLDANRRHCAVVDGAAKTEDACDTSEEPLDPRVMRSHRADRVRVRRVVRNVHEPDNHASDQRQTGAVTWWRSLSEGGR
jgi:hypothetical protein